MTPATMWTRLGWLLAAAALLVAVVPPEVVVVIARAVGLLACGALIWWYHRNADWKSSPIGRGTYPNWPSTYARRVWEVDGDKSNNRGSSGPVQVIDLGPALGPVPRSAFEGVTPDVDPWRTR